ncbi:RNA-guided endonuclease IscB, partial [Clostridium botulinum]
MPTNRYAKIRVLLKSKKAVVVNSKPFTIKLLYNTEDFVQPITLGIDSGYLNIGLSAITKEKELISAEVKLLKGMSERLKEKAMHRRQRRSRLRYRKPRFDNRKRSKDWLAPSIQHKYDSHIRFIDKLKKLLPITNIIIEVANFDTHKLKDPSIEGADYQNGEQKDFFNLREYILHRDGHKCQNPNCKNKNAESILQVHHIGFWKQDRSDRPGNLITLCNKCHTPKNHKKNGFLYGWQPKVKSFKEATFMSMIRWRLVNTLDCNHTYGYITKSNRIALKLEKTHYNDAFCIAGGSSQSRVNPLIFEQIKRNSRSLEKFYDAKVIDIRTNTKVSGLELFNGRRTRNKNLNSE